jgi:gas vesicle protein
MYYEEESGATGFVAGMLVGAIIGATIALLAAPQSGRALRTRVIGRSDASGEMDRDSIMAVLKQHRRPRR